MSDADDYRDRSIQCFRLAATAASPLQRRVLLDAAETWRALANRADRDRTAREPPESKEPLRRAG
jgi:hypothetical protein